MADKKAQLTVDGLDEAIELPVYSGTLGPDVIDVRPLTGNGLFTYDPGFVSTAACESAITFIDGGKGVLLHGGYPIDELAEKANFLSYSSELGVHHDCSRALQGALRSRFRRCSTGYLLAIALVSNCALILNYCHPINVLKL